MERIFTFAPHCSKTDGGPLVFNKVTKWVEGYSETQRVLTQNENH